MPNPYGITLDEASIRWAATEGVSEMIITAVLLLHERSVDEVAAKLTPDELGHVIRLVGRPSCYPPGTLAALKSRSLTHSHEPPSVVWSTDQAPSQRTAHTGAERLQRYRAHDENITVATSCIRKAQLRLATTIYGTRNGVTPTMSIAASTAEPVSASALRVRRHRKASPREPTSLHRRTARAGHRARNRAWAADAGRSR